MRNFRVTMDPAQRQQFLQETLIHTNEFLAANNLPVITEDRDAAYCPLPLTNTPEALKPIVRSRQKILMQRVLTPAGFKPYDPGTAKYSPDLERNALPSEVYSADAIRIARARFFTDHRFLPSDGFGAESEIASTLNRIAVILFDKNLRVSRMQPRGAICLQYEDFAQQAKEFIPIFKMLKDFEPGKGLDENILPILVGFPKNGGAPVNLEQEVYKNFPKLKYIYDGNAPVAKMTPDMKQFYEHR